VERVVLNALKKWLRRLIFAPPATGSASVFGELTYFLARYALLSFLFVAQATQRRSLHPLDRTSRRAVYNYSPVT
jgi:hypothetical protein